jgi:membrane protein
MYNLRVKMQEAANFIRNDIWRIHRAQLSSGKSLFVKLLRVMILSVRGFKQDKCQLRSSALTLYSLISIIPVAAMAFGIAKGFGFEKLLEAQLRDKLGGYEEILTTVIQISHSLLANTRGGLMAGVGLVILLWAVIKVWRQIEYSFNDIWKINKQRTIGRMFSYYLSLMLVCPVIFILSSGVTVFVTTQVSLIVEKFSIMGSFSPLIFFLLKLLPYILMWSLFTFLYIFMPNTKVRFFTGLFSGIITGTAIQIVQWTYITFQIVVAKHNAIYGSFAALPLFLIWLQLSWLIVLFGAEMSFAYQNVDTYEFDSDVRQASHRFRVLFSLLIAGCLIKNFIRGGKPMTAGEISNQLGIPIRFVDDILCELKRSNIISVVDDNSGNDRGYQPAVDVGMITIQYIIEAIEKRGINSMPFTANSEFVSMSALLDAFDRNIEQLPENKLLKDL